MIIKWIGAIICWIVAFFFITLGFVHTRELHEKKSLLELSPEGLEYTLDTMFGWIIGIFIWIIGLIGRLLKALPWWEVKLIYVSIGVWFAYLGFRSAIGIAK